MHYKAPDNSLHFIEPEFAHLLPSGCVPVSAEEVEAIRAASIPAPTPIDLLNKLDADNQLTQRNLRETIMLMSEAFKSLTSGQLDLSLIPGVAKVYAIEAKAQEYRNAISPSISTVPTSDPVQGTQLEVASPADSASPAA